MLCPCAPLAVAFHDHRRPVNVLEEGPVFEKLCVNLLSYPIGQFGPDGVNLRRLDVRVCPAGVMPACPLVIVRCPCPDAIELVKALRRAGKESVAFRSISVGLITAVQV